MIDGERLGMVPVGKSKTVVVNETHYESTIALAKADARTNCS